MAADFGGERLPSEPGESLVAFASAPVAVACALEMQVADIESGSGESRLRLAVHTAEFVRDDSGSHGGPELARAWEICGLTQAGQVTLSQATADLAADRLPNDASTELLGSALIGTDDHEPLYTLRHPKLDAAGQRLPLGAVASSVPQALTPLLGRSDELKTLDALLQKARLVTIHGSAGCGKTRLAAELASVRTRDERVAWADLVPAQDERDVRAVIVTALGLPHRSAMAPWTNIGEMLGGSERLLFVDNCEHVLDAAAKVVAGLLRAAPTVTIVSTSRVPLELDGEHKFQIRPLGLPDGTDLSAMREAPAVQLFLERARAARGDFELSARTSGAIEEVCRRLDGIPLALELAAARVAVMSVADIARRLDDRFGLLVGGGPDRPARHRTLRTSLEWSVDLLQQPERDLLARLSILTAPFDHALAAALAPPTDTGPPALEVLGSLVAHSLVEMTPYPYGTRYRLFESVRDLGRRLLDESGAASDARRAVIDHLLPGNSDHRASVHPANLRLAVGWAHESGRSVDAMRLVSRRAADWRGGWTDIGEVEDPFDAAESISDPRVRARALFAAMFDRRHFGRMHDALAQVPRVAAAARASDDPPTIALVLSQLGVVLRHAALGGDAEFDEAVAAARDAGDPILQVRAGYAKARSDTMVEGVRGAEPALGLLRKLSQQTGILSDHLDWLEADVALASGRLGEAESRYLAALEAARATGDQALHEGSLFGLGEMAALRGDADLVLARIGEARALKEDRTPFDNATFQLRATTIALRLGADASLVEEAEETLAFWKVGEVPYYQAWAQLLLGDCRARLGQLEEAEPLLIESLDVQRAGRFVDHRAWAATALATVARRRGKLVEAEQFAHEALETAERAGLHERTVVAVEALASILGDLGAPEQAVRAKAVAVAARRANGTTQSVHEAESGSADEEALRERLGDEQFLAAWEGGATLALPEIVGILRRGRGPRERPDEGWSALTPAELDVVRLVAEGLPNREIAERLFVSPNTVKTHLKHAFAKLGVSSRAEVAAIAARREAATP